MNDTSPERNNRNYIHSRINPILEKMVVDILLQRPEKMVPFMIKWLQDNGQKYSNDSLNSPPKKKSIHRNAYGESSEEDDEEVIDDLPQSQKNDKVYIYYFFK